MSFFSELRRRNVFRAGVAYAVVGWLLIEVASTILPIFEAPQWVLQTITFVIFLEFPLVLVLSWAFELTPQGIERTSTVPAEASSPPATGRKLNYVITVVLALAVIVFAVDRFLLVPNVSMPQAEIADRRPIAALPFANESAAEENAEFFANGIHDNLLTQLAKVSSLKVISRTSVMEYRDSPKNMRQIGQELGVATILEGLKSAARL